MITCYVWRKSKHGNLLIYCVWRYVHYEVATIFNRNQDYSNLAVYNKYIFGIEYNRYEYSEVGGGETTKHAHLFLSKKITVICSLYDTIVNLAVTRAAWTK